MTSDVPGAKSFYCTLFGWSARDAQMPGIPYTLFSKGGADLGGLMPVPEMDGKPVCGPAWVAYVRVDDVDASLAKARELGGAVDAGPMDVPGVGRIGFLRDPFGAAFAVYKPA
jgi:predicted enzyme related to lactoylglutathione lyase